MERRDCEAVVLKRGWLSAQPEPFRRAVLDAAHVVAFEAGEYVYHFGDDAGGVFGLCSGGIGLHVPVRGSELRLAHILRAGVWFGAGPYFIGSQRAWSYQALQPTVALRMPLASFRRISVQRPEFAQYAGAFAELASQTSLRLVADLLIPDAARRLAAIILRTADAAGEPAGQAKLIATQAQIAEMANLSSRVVSRALKQFADKGWVETRYNALQIADARSLSGFADGACA